MGCPSGTRGATFVAALFALTAPLYAAFPAYSYLEHPLHKLPELNSAQPTPVVVAKYYKVVAGKPSVVGRFFPRAATYFEHPTNAAFASGLDALVMGFKATATPNTDTYLEVHVNIATRVVLLLSGKGIRNRRIAAAPVVTGLTGWASPRVLINRGNKDPLPGITSKPNKLPVFGVAVEQVFPAGSVIRIPDPNSVGVSALDPADPAVSPTLYTVMFARPTAGAVVALPAPSLPSLATLNAILPTLAQVTEPVPNQRCPDWVHDIHVTKTHDLSSGPGYWKTWHPQIDSVYWCYFGHEHGTYPGNYRPRLGYTAYRTADPNGPGGRQDESHNGFKTFSFLTPDNGFAIVATFHAHLSSARRFTARRHTMMFAAFGVQADGSWTPLVELYMKMDFGATLVRLAAGGNIPVPAQTALHEELRAKKIIAMRRVNVINAALTGPGADPQIKTRVYEKWAGPLNTCSRSKKGGTQRGLEFDFRNAASGMLDLDGTTTDANMPYFERGSSLNRVGHVRAGGMRVGAGLCEFDETEQAFPTADGVFYTDSDFSATKSGPGEFHLKQFISPGLTELVVPGGNLLVSDPWSGPMEYRNGAMAKGFFANLEESLDRRIN